METSMRLGMRGWFFGIYLVANLAIILFSIWLWSRRMSAEALFVTFRPFERRSTSSTRSADGEIAARLPLGVA
jgi:hypothetical protein